MPLRVVDPLQTVEVDEREHEPRARAMGALDLQLYLREPVLTRVSTGQRIRDRALELSPGFGTLPIGLGSILGSLLAVDGRAAAVVGCRFARSAAARTLSLPGVENDVPCLPGLLVIDVGRKRGRVTSLCLPIARLGHLITTRRRVEASGRCVGSCVRDSAPVTAGALTRQLAPVVGRAVAPGREIFVRGLLILVRASLVARLPPVRDRTTSGRYRLPSDPGHSTSDRDRSCLPNQSRTHSVRRRTPHPDNGSWNLEP